MVALVALIEVAIARHEDRFTASVTPLAWRTAGRAARSEARDAEVLCLGDSLVKHGVLPGVLEAETGYRAYNLALPAAPPPAAYFLLRRALKSGARPAALVVDFHATGLPPPPRGTLEFWPELLDGRDLIDLGWTARGGGLVGPSGVAMLLPSARLRRGIRLAALEAIGAASGDRLADYRAAIRNSRINRGALVSAPAATAPPEAEDLGASAPRSARWQPHPTNVTYLYRLLDLAESRRLPVVWLMPPVSPAWQNRAERLGLDDRYTRFAREILDRYPGLTIVDGRRSRYPRRVFADPTHLNVWGAATLSADLGSAVQLRLSGEPCPRWIELPAFRDRPEVAQRVEHFAESQAVLAKESDRVLRR